MVTIKDLAARLGLSSGTVSLALNGAPRISAATRKRVVELADALGYRPNSFARALQSGKSRLLGCLTAGLSGSFLNAIFEGIGTAAAAADYGLLTGWAQRGEVALLAQLELMLSKRVDGVVIMGGLACQQRIIARLDAAKIPYVACSAHVPPGIPVVITDDELGGRIAATYVLDCGHRRILCEDYGTELRLSGNLTVLNRTPGARYAIFRNQDELPGLVRDFKPTAIIAYCDLHALDIIFALRRLGVRVPEEISVIGYDDIPIAARPEFALTTITQQQMALGRESVRYLLRRIHGEKPPITQLLPPALTVRKTVVKISLND